MGDAADAHETLTRRLKEAQECDEIEFGDEGEGSDGDMADMYKVVTSLLDIQIEREERDKEKKEQNLQLTKEKGSSLQAGIEEHAKSIQRLAALRRLLAASKDKAGEP